METKIIEKLAKEWQNSGIEKGDVVLVHSSLSRLIREVKKKYDILISPQDVYDSLLNAIGKNGTLILPLFNFDFPKTKFFDIRISPSHMGALTEIGRKNKNAVRTGHPIYSFSIIGKHSDKFKNIDNYSGYGQNSPFAKIKELNGKIAVIGLSDQNSMTSYHFVEEQNLVNYRYFKEFEGEYIDKNGIKSNRKYSLFVRDIDKGVKTDVNRMMDYLWNNNLYKGEQYNQGFGMRTIDFNTFFNEVKRIIKKNDAINFLYSIEKP